MTTDRDRLLDAQVQQADPDRWLASRFVADAGARADLIALYAFEAELTAIPSRVSQPLLAEMRYVWWRDQMDGVFSGAPRRGHPVLEALADLSGRHDLDRSTLDALIDAHIDRIHMRPHDLDALFAAPMRQAVHILAGLGHEAPAEAAGHLLGLLRTGRHDEARALRPQVNQAIRALPSQAFPAVAPAALDPNASAARKRLMLTWAVLRGRL